MKWYNANWGTFLHIYIEGDSRRSELLPNILNTLNYACNTFQIDYIVKYIHFMSILEFNVLVSSSLSESLMYLDKMTILRLMVFSRC